MNYSQLFALLRAQSEDDLKAVCQIAVRNSSNVDDEEAINHVKNLLSVDRSDAKKTLNCINCMVTLQTSENKKLNLPETLPKEVAEIVAKRIVDLGKGDCAFGSSYMPQLKDFNWRVDVKVASDAASRISVPTCLLQLNIRDPPTEVGILENESRINVELTKEAMETVLDGLGKIRDQLSNISK